MCCLLMYNALIFAVRLFLTFLYMFIIDIIFDIQKCHYFFSTNEYIRRALAPSLQTQVLNGTCHHFMLENHFSEVHFGRQERK